MWNSSLASVACAECCLYIPWYVTITSNFELNKKVRIEDVAESLTQKLIIQFFDNTENYVSLPADHLVSLIINESYAFQFVRPP